MNYPDPSSSGHSPNPGRFTSQQITAEDLLKSQTEGLVTLSDYRKRRLEAIEQREMGILGSTASSGTNTPDGAETPQPVKKKAKKATTKPKGKLSFALDDEEDEDSSLSAAVTPRFMSKSSTPRDQTPNEDSQDGDDSAATRKKLKPNANVAVVAKARTKAVLLREAQAREQMRKDFLVTKELVKNTDIVVPFIFYDGAKTPGGKVRVKKGDHIWVFLDKARKVGAELAIGEDKGGKSWARVSVDDLMFHFEFYYFPSNDIKTPDGPIFTFSTERTPATPPVLPEETAATIDPASYDPLARRDREEKDGTTIKIADRELEGFNDDPQATKVVDRRWYERNKHIYPMSTWEEYDAKQDYKNGVRKDTEGNSFFF
ncbi:putative rhamnogalacturonate lyase A [Venturia nashicola]|uniref:Putative rhamnogalacturonate lyase A n=1 Tax=Venturia nashicola TaxID=86259 RepID=A0A4Z1P9N1_9PEZI|nr:putative rhamnogalacturonate lyase A [Venturia nashicola]